jgi:hypothetical protein
MSETTWPPTDRFAFLRVLASLMRSMNSQLSAATPSIRTLLILGRVSNLPTIWSNCLAGWIIAGGAEWQRLALVGGGTTFLYVGGMFLNDAFDAEFDRQHRPERPIPSGAISRGAVWKWGFFWLVMGVLWVSLVGKTTAALGVGLAVCIVIYDAIHKLIVLAPFLMAACRFLVIMIASAAAANGIVGLSCWTGLVLGSYIVGLSYLARKESAPGALQYWPCIFLAAPLVLAIIINRGSYQTRGLILAGLVLFWVIRSLRFTYGSSQINIGRSVSGLLAGIVLVDLLSTGGLDPTHNLTFAGLFLLALVFQRMVPAT